MTYNPNAWYNKQSEQWTEDERLAAKLADAGLHEDEALAWVHEIMAKAWDQGYHNGVMDEFRNEADNSVNPYEEDQ